MNYIKSLETKNAELVAQLVAVNAEITSFLVHLNSSKFQGTESDGARKDWISTGDVIPRMMELRQLTLTDEKPKEKSNQFVFTEAAGRLHGQIVKLIRESSQSYLIEFQSDFLPYKKGDTICVAKYEAKRL